MIISNNQTLILLIMKIFFENSLKTFIQLHPWIKN